MEGCMADLGVRGVRRSYAGPDGAPQSEPPSAGCGQPYPASAVVAAAGQDVAVLSAEELREVLLRDGGEVEVGLRRDLRDVPEHVAELLGQRRAALVGQHAA